MTTDLKEIREQLGLSIDDVAKSINIKREYLAALEGGNFEIIPGPVYVNGYLKLYAKYLGISLPTANDLDKIGGGVAISIDLVQNKIGNKVWIISTLLLILSISMYGMLSTNIFNKKRTLLQQLELYNSK